MAAVAADVDCHRVRSRIEIDAAVVGAAVVLHLEGKARVTRFPSPLAPGRTSTCRPMMSVTLTNCPAVTAVPLSFNVPAVGSVVISTR